MRLLRPLGLSLGARLPRLWLSGHSLGLPCHVLRCQGLSSGRLTTRQGLTLGRHWRPSLHRLSGLWLTLRRLSRLRALRTLWGLPLGRLPLILTA